MQEITVITYWVHIAAIYFRITFTKNNFLFHALQLASLLCIDVCYIWVGGMKSFTRADSELVNNECVLKTC